MPVADAVGVGQELPSLVKEMSQRRIDVYSGVRPRSIHTDEAWAHQKGFRTTLAQGMMSTAFASEMMTRLLGEGFVRGGTLSMAFIKPVYAGDRLTVRGVVKETRPEGGRTRVVVEVWCENQHGEKTAVGTASGLIPA
ncbi:MAG TPA: MaoC family dehydratase [Methylomirabilota bacterium]|jgi:acyl dehydratase|nr:MaoC family dehydratase [Methylomirabilota bacterium]